MHLMDATESTEKQASTLTFSKFKYRLQLFVAEVEGLQKKEEATTRELQTLRQKHKADDLERSEEKSKLCAELAAAISARQRLEGQNSDLHREIDTLVQREKHLQHELSAVLHHKSADSEEIKVSKYELERSLQSKESELKLSLDKLERQASLIESFEGEMQEVHQALTETYRALLEEIQQHKNLVLQGQKLSNEQQLEIEKKQRELKDLRKQVPVLQEEGLKSQIDNENSKLRHQVQELQDAISAANEQVAVLQAASTSGKHVPNTDEVAEDPLQAPTVDVDAPPKRNETPNAAVHGPQLQPTEDLQQLPQQEPQQHLDVHGGQQVSEQLPKPPVTAAIPAVSPGGSQGPEPVAAQSTAIEAGEGQVGALSEGFVAVKQTMTADPTIGVNHASKKADLDLQPEEAPIKRDLNVDTVVGSPRSSPKCPVNEQVGVESALAYLADSPLTQMRASQLTCADPASPLATPLRSSPSPSCGEKPAKRQKVDSPVCASKLPSLAEEPTETEVAIRKASSDSQEGQAGCQKRPHHKSILVSSKPGPATSGSAVLSLSETVERDGAPPSLPEDDVQGGAGMSAADKDPALLEREAHISEEEDVKKPAAGNAVRELQGNESWEEIFENKS
eukprot:jgi/Mesen1/5984/ME000302S04985